MLQAAPQKIKRHIYLVKRVPWPLSFCLILILLLSWLLNKTYSFFLVCMDLQSASERKELIYLAIDCKAKYDQYINTRYFNQKSQWADSRRTRRTTNTIQTKTSILHRQLVQYSYQRVRALSQISLSFWFSYKYALIIATSWTNFLNKLKNQTQDCLNGKSKGEQVSVNL